MSGYEYSPSPDPRIAATAWDEYFLDTGIRLDYLFQGDSATEAIRGNITLAATGTALVDQLVQDTLDFPTFLHSHAYEGQAGADSWDSDGSIDFGTGSAMLHVSGFGPVVPVGIVDVAGNQDNNDGMTIQIDSAGNLIGTATIAASSISRTIGGSACPDTWWEAVLLLERSTGMAGTLYFATIDTIVSIAVGAGSLNSARAFSIFSGRVTGFVGQVMSARLAFGDQLLGKGVRAREFARSTAQRIWHEPVFTRVVAPLK